MARRLITGGQRAEDGGQTTDDRGRRTEDGGQTTEDGGRTTDDRRQTTEDRGQRADDRGRRTEDGGQRAEGIVAQLSAWLGELGGDITLNVAGSRESKAPGIGEKVREILVRGLDFRLNRAMLIC